MGEFLASLYKLSATVGVLPVLKVFVVKGELCPETVVSAEVSESPVDEGDCHQITLRKLAQDMQNNFI